MSEQGYPIVITRISEEDGGGFLAFVPDLRGCMADGETQEAAAQGIQSAIGEWIDEAKRMGRDVPEPGSMNIKAQHDRNAARKERRELYAALKAQAKIIKKQEKMLEDARTEVERVQAAAESLIEAECAVDLDVSGDLWVVSSVLAAGHSGKKSKLRLLS